MSPQSFLERAFAALRFPDFRRLFGAQLCHGLGLWMELVARPFLVIEIVEEPARHLGGVIAVTALPQLLLGLWAGPLSDWFDRGRVLLYQKAALWLLYLCFFALLVAGELALWHVYAYTLLRGAVMAFDQPARQALIPSIVSHDGVPNAVALLSATQNTVRIVGASLGGAVYALFGPLGVYGAVVMISLGAVLLTARLRVPPHTTPGRASGRALLGGLVEGARYTLGQPVLRTAMGLSMALFGFGMSYLQVFLPLFAEEVLKIGSQGFGTLSALTGVGATSAALLIAARPPRRVGRLLPLLVVGFGLTMTAFSAATLLQRPAGLWLPLGLVCLSGAATTCFFALARTLVLQTTPEALRGRVVSFQALERACMAAGALGAGFLCSAWGVQAAQMAYALLCVVAGGAVALAGTALRAAGSPALLPLDEKV